MFDNGYHTNTFWSSRVFWAMMLIATGVVFLLMQTGAIDESGNWWVIYLLLPGAALVGNAFISYARHRRPQFSSFWQFGAGALLIFLAIIFVFDPDWSFINTWTGVYDDLFNSLNWDMIWRWAIALVGVGLVVTGMLRGSRDAIGFGVLVASAGVVFVLDLDWDEVWPVFLIIAGVLMLAPKLSRPRY
jgi:hypothetical protein